MRSDTMYNTEDSLTLHISTLYHITWKVVDLLYGSNLGCGGNKSVADSASSILQIDQGLLSWQTSLPCHMRLIHHNDLLEDDSLTLVRRLRVILTLRYHSLRVLAHRPILDRCLQLLADTSSARSDDAMLWQVGYRSKAIAFQSAESIIKIVSTLTRSTTSQHGLLGAWWFSLYYSSFNTYLPRPPWLELYRSANGYSQHLTQRLPS